MEDEPRKKGQGATSNIKLEVKEGVWRRTRQPRKESQGAAKTKVVCIELWTDV